MYHLLPFSLRVGFRWEDRARAVEHLSAGLGKEFVVRALEFGELGLLDLPESYRRRSHGWVQIILPIRYVNAIDARRRDMLRQFGGDSPQPSGAVSTAEILLAQSG